MDLPSYYNWLIINRHFPWLGSAALPIDYNSGRSSDRSLPMSQPAPEAADRPMPLAGITIIDAATIFAGPLAATFMGDFGADVIKVEHPERGDSARNMARRKNGVPLWWKQ